jgi:hypothetical protein
MLNLFNYNSLQCSLAIGMLHWWYQSLSNFGSTVLLTDVDTCVCVNTCVISRDAAAALIWRLGCLTELLQSNARANVPTDLTNTNESIQIESELHSGQNEVTALSEYFYQPGHNKKLVNFTVCQVVICVPNLGFKKGQIPSIVACCNEWYFTMIDSKFKTVSHCGHSYILSSRICGINGW